MCVDPEFGMSLRCELTVVVVNVNNVVGMLDVDSVRLVVALVVVVVGRTVVVVVARGFEGRATKKRRDHGRVVGRTAVGRIADDER